MNLFPRLINRISLATVLLIMAIILGTVVRTWKITTLPFPPNGDELAFGYYGWSLLHYQTDEYGTHLPITFPSIGDYKYPGLAYLNIIPAAIFGLSEIITRFWSVLSGIILIPVIYFLTFKLFKSKMVATAAAWIIALSPWDITLSRLGYENHIALTLIVSGFLCLFLAMDNNLAGRKKNFISGIGFCLLTLSTFCYAAERFFVLAILAIVLVLSFFGKFHLSQLKKPTLIFFLILFTITLIFLIPWQNRGRAEKVMWQGLDAKETNRLQELYIESRISPIQAPRFLVHIFHNPLRIGVEDFLYRYANHFSPKFLFFEGEAATEKVPDTGVLPLLLIVFLPLGLLTILKDKFLQSSLFILTWLVIAPIPSSLTLGEPHINRASLMIPAITIIAAFGFVKFVNFFSGRKKVAAGLVIVVLFLFNSLYVINQIFIHKPVSKPWVSEQVNKLMVEQVFRLKNQYQAVVIPKDEYIFFLFYNSISPEDFLKRSTIRPASRENSWDRVERLDNIYFNMPYDCPKGGKLHVLYICKGPNIPQNSKVLQVIRYLDLVPAYTLIEFIPISQIPIPQYSLPKGLQYMVDLEKSPTTVDGLIPSSQSRLW